MTKKVKKQTNKQTKNRLVLFVFCYLTERITEYMWLQPEHVAWKNFKQSRYHIRLVTTYVLIEKV